MNFVLWHLTSPHILRPGLTLLSWFFLSLSNVYGLYRWLGVNLLLLEYRGYGLSSGSPSEAGLYLDAQAAVSYLKTRTDIDQAKIIIFGRSLGRWSIYQ